LTFTFRFDLRGDLITFVAADTTADGAAGGSGANGALAPEANRSLEPLPCLSKINT
jgi:hypothetical protein